MASGIGSPSVCLPLEVEVTKTFWNADPVGLWVGFLIGAIVGALFAIPCGIALLRDIVKKMNKDPEAAIAEASVTKTEVTTVLQQPDYDAKKTKKKKSLKKKKKELESEDVSGFVKPLNENKDKSEEDTDAKGVVDALVKNNGEEMDAELASQDLDSYFKLEKDIKDEEITSFLMLMRSLLGQAMMKNGVGDKRSKECLKNFQDSVIAAKQQVQQENEEAEQELKNDPKLAKDPNILDRELQKLQLKYVACLDELLDETRDILKEDLKKDLGFSDKEAEYLINEHKRVMSEVECKLAVESLRHAAVLEEKLARRKLLSEQHNTDKKEERDDVPERRELYENVLQQLVDDGKMLERQKDDLLNSHEQNLRRIQASHEEDRQRQELILAEKLKKKRETVVNKLKDKQQKEKENFMRKADKISGGDDMIAAYHELLQEQRIEREQMDDQLDNNEAEAMDKLAEEQSAIREKELKKENGRFQENLEVKGQLSERDIDKVIATHNQEKAEYNRQKVQEKKNSEMKLQERLAQRRQNSEDEKSHILSEQAALTNQQEASIKKVLDTQLDLDEEAKKKILQEHEKSMQKVNAQLSMSQLRQQKELEKRLTQRKAKVAGLRDEAQKAKDGGVNSKDSEKRQQQIQQQIKQEEHAIEQQQQSSLAELRKRLAEETQVALAAQEKEISIAIAKLQVGAARRQDILHRQEKTIKDLEEQMANKIETEGVEDRAIDYLLEQHDANVASVEQRMMESKQRNEQMLAEKLQQKKLKKERDIQNKIQDEAEQELEDQHHRGAGVASNLMVQVMMEQRHKRALEDLEKEMRIEMNRQREEISRELENEMELELQEQKKNFLSQLAAVSNMSKADVNDLVNNAVLDSGGDEKQAKRLAKDLRLGLQRAKTDMGIEDDQPTGRTRNKTSLDFDNDAYEEEGGRRMSGRTRRKPRNAFVD